MRKLGIHYRGVALRRLTLATGLLTALPLWMNRPAYADCTPAAADGVTAFCTGTTTNQGGGAPGTSASVQGFGYGTGSEAGVTINVGTGSTLTGNSAGISIHDGTVTNESRGIIWGPIKGVVASGNLTLTNKADGSIFTTGPTAITVGGTANINNSGGIIGLFIVAVAVANGSVVNNAGGRITGDIVGVSGGSGVVVSNYGIISSNNYAALEIFGGSVVTNAASGSIFGLAYGILASGDGLSVFNVGSIAGTFAISTTGSGTSIFNAGSIFGGSTAIQFGGGNNTLTLAPGSSIQGLVSASGSDTFQLGGHGTAVFDLSSIGAAQQYRGFSTFNVVDNATWTVTGTYGQTNPWTVKGGTLNVSGDLSAATNLTVAGGTLVGVGTVGATQVNSGAIFAPGNGSPGTSMTVSGNLAFQQGAIYQVRVNPSIASFATVSGTATLDGATVNAFYALGSYVNKQYTILTATGGVSGTFGSLVNTNLPANFQTALSYDANDAYLNLFLNYALPSGNQQAVGNALTGFFNSNGSIPLLYGSLSAGGLTQASGESATGSQQATFNAMHQFMGLLADPFMGRGNGFGGASAATGYAEEGDQTSAYAARHRDDAFAMFTKAPPAALVPRWNVWVAGYGGSQSTSGNAAIGSNDTTSRIAGTAVGADYLFSPNTLAGFALAGGGTSFSVNTLGGGRSDLFQAGAYIRHTDGPAYVTAALAYGWQDITTNRTVTAAGIDQLRAEFNANAYSGRLEGGYRFVAPWTGGVGITPYAAGEFTSFELPAYAEQATSGLPSFALRYAGRSVTDPRSELGVRTDKSFLMQDGILTLRTRFAWAHDCNPNRLAAATFQALPGASFVVNGAAQASDSALTTASVDMKWRNGWSAAATFEGEFSNVTSSYAGKGVVRYAW
ncbi:autotransporter domain-containing protein [Bradyrhizobium quebecense]|uniref:Autotransporter domain-containing protein n=1 Tax=Bradyrhizobium quebecense TaxID=2748629 RepID=A0A973WVJ6_9BRAD|nr:autotransporter outer membrane beta-barrel domain-containing protein [Bradyrhizobium quebecense]UGA44569.1 autotransporter domain-containing protein [Bradyrhizobium quebecense]